MFKPSLLFSLGSQTVSGFTTRQRGRNSHSGGLFGTGKSAAQMGGRAAQIGDGAFTHRTPPGFLLGRHGLSLGGRVSRLCHVLKHTPPQVGRRSNNGNTAAVLGKPPSSPNGQEQSCIDKRAVLNKSCPLEWPKEIMFGLWSMKRIKLLMSQRQTQSQHLRSL